MKQQEKKPLIILTGPTAAGKTSLSIELAKSIGGEIISADSMQVYKKMRQDMYQSLLVEQDFISRRYCMILIFHSMKTKKVTVKN